MSEAFEGYAILELMGHRRLAGFVRETTIAGAGLLRIDIPMPDGTTATQFYPPSALYCLTPTTEEIARGVSQRNQPEPVHRWELPRLPAPTGQSDDDRAADVAEFLERYMSGPMVLDNDVLDRLETAIEQAAMARAEVNDYDDD